MGSVRDAGSVRRVAAADLGSTILVAGAAARSWNHKAAVEHAVVDRPPRRDAAVAAELHEMQGLRLAGGRGADAFVEGRLAGGECLALLRRALRRLVETVIDGRAATESEGERRSDSKEKHRQRALEPRSQALFF